MAMPAQTKPDAEDQNEAPEGPEAEQGEQDGGGDAAKLVTDIHTDLMKLLHLVQSAGLPPEDAHGLQQIVQGFQDYVQNVLGAAQGEQPGGDKESAPGQVPMEAGGNPNARPMV